jgi:hypothetical protein
MLKLASIILSISIMLSNNKQFGDMSRRDLKDV